MICPCKGCTKRWVSDTSRCHASCTEYKQWHKFVRDLNTKAAKTKAEEDFVSSVLFGHRRKR